MTNASFTCNWIYFITTTCVESFLMVDSINSMLSRYVSYKEYTLPMVDRVSTTIAVLNNLMSTI